MIDPVILLVLIVLIVGIWLGLVLGRWRLLSRLHHDDVEEAHKKYRQRKEKYL